MAQGGRIQQPNIYVTVNVTQDGDQLRTTNIEQQTNIDRSEIGQILAPQTADPHPGAAGAVDVGVADEEGNLAADSAAHIPRSQPQTSQQELSTVVRRMSLSEQHRDNHVEEEKADALIKDSKFQEAVDLLEDLPPSQRQQMQLMDCYFQLGMNAKLVKCIETMQMLMTRHPRPNADDVYNLGVKNFATSSQSSMFSGLLGSIVHSITSPPRNQPSSSHIRALALLSCAAKLYQFDSNADNAVAKLTKCSLKCLYVIGAMIKQGERMRVVASDIGLNVMHEILKDVRSLDANPNVRAEKEARCVNNIGVCYNELNHTLEKFAKSLEYYKQGFDIMNRQFGARASRYRVFGHILHNLGRCNEILGNYYEAETWCTRALDAYKRAQDWESEKQKKEEIEITENYLRLLREKMKK